MSRAELALAQKRSPIEFVRTGNKTLLNISSEMQTRLRAFDEEGVGDTDAWTDFFSKTLPYLEKAVKGMLKKMNTVNFGDEIIQDTMLSFYNVARSDREILWETVPSYLTSIAHNKAVDVIRREERNKRRLIYFDDIPQEDRDFEEKDNEILRIEQKEVLGFCISQLPPEQRQVLMLGYYEQMTLVEISKAVGIPLGTAKTRMHSARQNIMKLAQTHRLSLESFL